MAKEDLLPSFQVSSQECIILMSPPQYKYDPHNFGVKGFDLVVDSGFTGCRECSEGPSQPLSMLRIVS